ncbi:anti-sigma B factor antagonist [Microbispora sp. ATCC PTA-5024]|nr:anti-sigma B factor antagonist [Microbispora sp. ATCC PTA-5024]
MVVVDGEIDVYTGPYLRNLLTEVLHEHAHVIVDMSRVDFFDSTGLGILVGGLKRARGRGGSLVLVIADAADPSQRERQDKTRKYLRITGMSKVFPVYGDRMDAVRRYAEVDGRLTYAGEPDENWEEVSGRPTPSPS